jgi:hypothetical protein
MMDSSDSKLVKQSLAGNRDAFGWIVARHQSLLWVIPMFARWRVVAGSRRRRNLQR